MNLTQTIYTDQKVKLNRFDLDNIALNKTIVLIGKRGTGKSTIVADIMRRFKDEIDAASIINPTEDANQFYQKMFPQQLISTNINNDILQKALIYQENKIKKYNERKIGRPPSMAIVLDDCLYSNFWKKSEAMRLIFFNGRHYNILLIITLQDLMGIPCDLRSNVDYVFILIENRDDNRRKLHKYYGGNVTYKIFQKYMDKYTRNFGSIVIDNVTTETDPKRIYFKFRGHYDINPPTMCPQIRQFIRKKELQ